MLQNVTQGLERGQINWKDSRIGEITGIYTVLEWRTRTAFTWFRRGSRLLRRTFGFDKMRGSS
jgi:hypothetical protein